VKRLANGRERDLICSCQHGPAVHRGGRCVFQRTCGCRVFSPVEYVFDEPDCERCQVLEAELRELRATIPNLVPQQRKPLPAESRLVEAARRAHHRRPANDNRGH
jgi:hypothetical protein